MHSLSVVLQGGIFIIAPLFRIAVPLYVPCVLQSPMPTATAKKNVKLGFSYGFDTSRGSDCTSTGSKKARAARKPNGAVEVQSGLTAHEI